MTQHTAIDFFQSGDIDLTGVTAIVTGSRRGIGKAIALRLGREGANVVVNDVTSEGGDAEAVVNAVREAGAGATFIQADIADPTGREQLLRGAEDAFGQVDILVNNAGITRISDVMDETAGDFDVVMQVNLSAARFLTQLVTRRMIEQGRSGAVVNILSNAGAEAADNRAGYCEAKAALAMDTKLFAGRLIEHRIKVNGVVAGIIETDLTRPRLPAYQKAADLGYFPLMRMGQPDDVARSVVFAVRCYDTGAMIPCCGGVMLSTFNLRTMKAAL